jgi:outer membrane protease
MGGYNRSTVSYLSVGGCFIYGGGSAIGCFPENQIGIGYQQKFNTGYVGLTGSYFINKWDVNALFKYGPSVNAKDVDQHYQRSLTFKEKGHGADFYSFSLTSGYKIHSDLRVFLEGVYNQFDHQKADTTIINHNTNTLSRINNSAGLSYTNYMVSLGIQYNPAMS